MHSTKHTRPRTQSQSPTDTQLCVLCTGPTTHTAVFTHSYQQASKYLLSEFASGFWGILSQIYLLPFVANLDDTQELNNLFLNYIMRFAILER